MLSIIIPVYNSSKYLNECLASVKVASESFNFPLEVIIVDDGSKDDSLKIAYQWSDQWSKVRVFSHSQNRGVGAARNTGLSKAQGEWILWLDSDNRINPNGLQRIANAISTTPSVDAWILAMDLIDEQGKKFGSFYEDRVKVDPEMQLVQQPFSLLIGNFIDVFSVIRKSIALMEPFDETLPVQLEDWDMWIRILFRQRARVSFIRDAIGQYRQNPAGGSSKHRLNNPEYLDTLIQIYCKILLSSRQMNLSPTAIQSVILALRQASYYALQLIDLPVNK